LKDSERFEDDFETSSPPFLDYYALSQLFKWTASLSGRKVLPQLWQGTKDTSLYCLKASSLYD